MSENKLDIKALIAKANEFELDDINNIDWENMGSWPVLGKVVFCVLLFALVLTGGYFYIISDVIEVLKNAQEKEVPLKKELENKPFRVSNLDAYNAQLDEMEQKLGSLLKHLPRLTEVLG